MADETRLNGSFILDSSVIIKWFSEEEDTEKALDFREKHIAGEIELIDPDLLLYEVANALRYNKSINETDVKAAVDSLISLGIEIVVPTKEVTDEAISLAFQYNLTVYDAYFIALAKVLAFTFITADERLCRKVKGLPLVHLLKDYVFEEKDENYFKKNGEV